MQKWVAKTGLAWSLEILSLEDIEGWLSIKTVLGNGQWPAWQGTYQGPRSS